MSSHFEDMAQMGADLLLEQFGERDGDGVLKPHVIRLPSGLLVLWEASVGELTQRLVEEQGNIVARETCVLLGESSDLPMDLTPFKPQTRVFVEKYGDPEFHVDGELSRYGGPIVTLSLIRLPYSRINNLTAPLSG